MRPPTYSIRKKMRSIWNEQVGKADQFIPASTLCREIRQEADSRGFDPANFPVLNWIFVIDEFTLFFTMLYDKMYDATKTDNKDVICYKFLLGALASNLNSVVLLSRSGFDCQARILARAISEHVDILIFLFLDPERCNEYFMTQELEDCNKFWHKYVSKGKIKKAINKLIIESYPKLEPVIAELQQYQKEEEAAWSASIHPSYIACAMACGAGVSHGASGTVSVFGIADTSSVRTLSFVFYRLAELIAVGGGQLIYCIGNTDLHQDDHVDMLLNRLTFLRAFAGHVYAEREHLPLNIDDPFES